MFWQNPFSLGLKTEVVGEIQVPQSVVPSSVDYFFIEFWLYDEREPNVLLSVISFLVIVDLLFSKSLKMRSSLDRWKTLMANFAPWVSIWISMGTRLPMTSNLIFLSWDGTMSTLTGLQSQTRVETSEMFHAHPR